MDKLNDPIIPPPSPPSTSILNSLFLLILEILITSSVFLAVPFYWYIVLPVSRRSTWYHLLDYANRSNGIWEVEMTRWLLWLLHVALQLIISKRISSIVPKIIVNLSKWPSFPNYKSQTSTIKKMNELIAACADHLFNFLSCLSLYIISRHLFFREDEDRTWQYFLERTVLMLSVLMGFVLIEKAFLHLLAIEFHKSLYQERVFKSMYNQWILSTLREFLQQQTDWEKKTFPHRITDDLMSTFLLDKASNSQNHKFAARDQFCKEIFKFFDPKNDGKIQLKQFEVVFSPEDLRKAQNLLSNSSTSLDNSNTVPLMDSAELKTSLDRDTLKKSIQSVYQDRWDLSRALTTHASIIKKLDRAMVGFISAMILYFSPIVGYKLEKSNIFHFGVTLAPLMYSFTEFFGDSVKRICEAIIYIVTCHPYDVGDRVSIDGVEFFVHKIGLVSTIFKRFDGFMVWFPNYVLAKKALCNIRRTGMQGQRLEIQVDSSVPLEKLQNLSSQIKEFIKNDTKDFDAVTASFFDLHQSQNYLSIVFLLKHRFNFQDGVQRAERQNRFLFFLKAKVTELGIDYRPPVLRTLLEADEQIRNHLFTQETIEKYKDPFTSL